MELDNEIKSFTQKNPYEIGWQKESDGAIKYFMTKVETIPDNVNLLVGEVLQNLRTALDHMAVQIYSKRRMNTNIRSIFFPINESEVKFNEWTKKAPKEFSKDVINEIISIKPYRGGNDLLWQLNELNNIDKHRMLVTAGECFSGVDIGKYVSEMMKTLSGSSISNEDDSIIIAESKVDFPLVVGYNLFTDNVSKEGSSDWKFRFEIVIYEPGVVEGVDVIILLKKMIEEVKRIVVLLKPFQ